MFTDASQLLVSMATASGSSTALFIFLGIVALIVIITIAKMICIVPQATQWVIERLGRFDTVWSAGMHIRTPFLQSVRKKVSLQELSYDVPPQNVITKDNVTISADAYMLFSVFDVEKFTYKIMDPASAMNALCVSALRDIIGKMDLEECLTSRAVINKQMTQTLDEATDKWGIKVTRVEIKTFTPPRNIMDAMERQMKADREKREQIIRAEADKAAAILDAEKNKSVQVLNAEAARDAAELNAQANRIAVVKKAEAEKEAALLRAEAAKAVKIKEAEAQAEFIRLLDQAKADGIRAINESSPSDAAIRIKAYEAFESASNGQATKIIIPSDLQGIVGMASAVKSCLK